MGAPITVVDSPSTRSRLGTFYLDRREDTLIVVQAFDFNVAVEALSSIPEPIRIGKMAPMTPDALLLAALFFGAALLYSSVGHAGASAYLAAMALVGVPADDDAPDGPRAQSLRRDDRRRAIRAEPATCRGAAWCRWRSGSVPMAFLGGSIELPDEVYRPLVAVVLLVGAWRLATAP